MQVGLALPFLLLCMLSTPNIAWHQDKRVARFQATLQLFKATAPYDPSLLTELSSCSHYHLSLRKSTFNLLYLAAGAMSDLFLLNIQVFQSTEVNIEQQDT